MKMPWHSNNLDILICVSQIFLSQVSTFFHMQGIQFYSKTKSFGSKGFRLQEQVPAFWNTFVWKAGTKCIKFWKIHKYQVSGFSTFKKCQNDQFSKKTIRYCLWFYFKNRSFANSPFWCGFSLIFTKIHAYRHINKKTWYYQFFSILSNFKKCQNSRFSKKQ